MQTHIIEATNGFNWGKFLVGRFDKEWSYRSRMSDSGLPLLGEVGWTQGHLWVLDLQTGEGACFKLGGNAHADLNKHKIWVCPLFEPFLAWLYRQSASFEELPAVVELPEAEADFYGYRRPGEAATE